MGYPLALLASLVPAQSIDVAADVNSTGIPGALNASSNPAAELGAGDGSPQSFVQVGPNWYFAAETKALGRELWRTDGTPAGTALVADLYPGLAGSAPKQLTAHGGLLYFTAQADATGRELWRSDGTAAGTSLVADLNPGPNPSAPKSLTSWNGALWFTADDGTHGAEPWRSDGTAAGTALLLDVRPGADGSGPGGYEPAPGGASLLFRADDGVAGGELWRTDGTGAGTALLADVEPGPGSSDPTRLTPWNGSLYFRAFDAAHGVELWRTDGTPGGTALVADLIAGPDGSWPDLTYAVEFGGALHFAADGGSNVGVELFATDGTPAGTGLVAQVSPFAGDGSPTDLVVHGGALFFAADGWLGVGVGSVFVGRELWRIPAPGQPVELVADLQPGSGDGLPAPTCGLVSVGGQLFFSAAAGGGLEPAVSDGTPAGTGPLADLHPGSAASTPRDFTPLGPSAVLFTATDGLVGRELWATDGTPAGTQLFADLEPAEQTLSSSPTQVTSPDGRTLYFFADDGVHGREPWVWDPVGGKRLLADVRPGPAGSDSFAEAFTTAWFGGVERVVFVADDGVHGPEPWISDGTTAGTALLADVLAGATGSEPTDFQFFADRLWFAADDAQGVRRPWRSDGSAAGTEPLLAGAAGASLSSPGRFVRFADAWWFPASTPELGSELWKTDGTPEGTVLGLGAELLPGVATFYAVDHLATVGDRLCFTVGGPTVSPWKPYATDGTLAGTTILQNVNLGPTNLPPEGLVGFGGHLYFRASDAAHGAELWRTDGTPAGTALVLDALPGPEGLAPEAFVVSGDRVFYRASDPGFLQGGASDLWASDGTPGGTQLVLEAKGAIADGPELKRAVAASDGVYVAVRAEFEGTELFFSDGTPGGTALVDAALPGSEFRDPTFLTLANGDLYFSGLDPVVGRELLRAAPAGAYAVPIGHSGSGAELASDAPLLGGVLTATVVGAPSGSPAHALFYALPAAAAPFPLFDPGSSLLLEPLSAKLVAVSTATSFSKSVAVPADPSFAGAWLHRQVVSLPTSPFGGFTTSNGVSLVLGD